MTACLLAPQAQAHDTWLLPKAALAGAYKLTPGLQILLPGTGDFFPKADFQTLKERLETTQCREAGEARPHAVQENSRLGFQIGVKLQSASSPASCSASLRREYIELSEEPVGHYLDDIHATPAIRAHWSGLKAKGWVWRELYSKTARVELRPTLDTHSGGGIVEILAAQGNQPAAQGQTTTWRLLHAGKPLGFQWVQWIDGQGKKGWLQSNAAGELSLKLDNTGLWMLRGTVIRIQTPPLRDADGEEADFLSDFFTTVFWVSPNQSKAEP